MNPDPSLLTREGVLAVLLVQIVCNFAWRIFKTKRENGNGHAGKLDAAKIEAAIASVQTALALQQRDTLAKLEAIKDDGEHIRRYCHDIINGQAGVKTACELLIGRLERLDHRR